MDTDVVKFRLFHGTAKERAEIIANSGFSFIPRQKSMVCPPLSYGDGVYFFQDEKFASDHALEYFRHEGYVVQVSVTVQSERVRKFSWYELNEYGSAKVNRIAVESNLQVIDATRDQGIVIVRPESLNLIEVVGMRPVS